MRVGRRQVSDRHFRFRVLASPQRRVLCVGTVLAQVVVNKDQFSPRKGQRGHNLMTPRRRVLHRAQCREIEILVFGGGCGQHNSRVATRPDAALRPGEIDSSFAIQGKRRVGVEAERYVGGSLVKGFTFQFLNILSRVLPIHRALLAGEHLASHSNVLKVLAFVFRSSHKNCVALILVFRGRCSAGESPPGHVHASLVRVDSDYCALIDAVD